MVQCNFEAWKMVQTLMETFLETNTFQCVPTSLVARVLHLDDYAILIMMLLNNIWNMWEYGKHIGATINCRFYNLKTLEPIFQLPIHFD